MKDSLVVLMEKHNHLARSGSRCSAELSPLQDSKSKERRQRHHRFDVVCRYNVAAETSHLLKKTAHVFHLLKSYFLSKECVFVCAVPKGKLGDNRFLSTYST